MFPSGMYMIRTLPVLGFKMVVHLVFELIKIWWRNRLQDMSQWSILLGAFYLTICSSVHLPPAHHC